MIQPPNNQPGAEVASERAEAGVEIRIKPMLCKHCGEPMEEYVHKCKVLGLQQQLDDERNPNCDGSLAFHLAESNQREKEAREKFQKAAKWNNLTELEITNLRSLNSGLNEDIATLRAQLEAKEGECRELREENAVLKSQVENADINLQQVHLTQKGIWRTKVESAEKEITRLTAELDVIVNQLARRTALDGFATTGEKISALLKIASAYDPKAELAKSLAELDAVRKALDIANSSADDQMVQKREAQARCGELERAGKELIAAQDDFDTAIGKRENELENGFKTERVKLELRAARTRLTKARSVFLTPSQQPDNFDSSGSANPSEHQPNALAGWAHAVTGEQPREYCGASEHKPQGNGKQERDLPAVNPSRPEPVIAGECPICGALEVEANHPRTFYACGSSDYDQRPGTFIQSARCVPPIAPEGKATEGEG